MTIADRLDFLSAPFAADECARRDGSAFDLDLPWTLFRFGSVTFDRGWWTLACEGEGETDLSGVDVRLSSPDDPWLMFGGDQAGVFRTYFGTPRTFDVVLLASPWPGRVAFRTLALRRLGVEETTRLAVGALARLSRRGDAVRRITHLARNLMAGRTVGMQTGPAPAINETSRPAGSATKDPVAPPVVLVHEADVSILMHAGDRLEPRALDWVRTEFHRNPHVQAIYGDTWEAGQLAAHPAWDSELAQHADFVGLPVFYRGRLDRAPERPWDHLKAVAERSGASAIARIPLPLAERDHAIARALIRIPEPRLDSPPRVSVIIPTKIRIDLLDLCLQGLARTTSGVPLEVVVVNNGSEDASLPDVLARARKGLMLKEVLDPGPFNFSRLVNRGVAASTGEIVLLLNDDVVPEAEGWLHRMIESVMRPEIGVVGARLHYPDGSIQHAGVVMGVGGVCGHLWKDMGRAEAERFPVVACPGERLAVTGACLAVRREVWDKVDGFDEANFPVALNDIDFCLRVRTAGYRTLYRGDAALVHHESQSRGLDELSMEKRLRLAQETTVFFSRWRSLLRDDPHGSPAFDQSREQGGVHRALKSPMRTAAASEPPRDQA